MSVNISPSTAFEATVAGFASGLVGTVGVKIVDNIGGTTTARTTTNMVELVAGSGTYAKAFTVGEAPATQGQYSLVWDDGSGNYAIDDLIVGGTPVTLVFSTGNADLTTLAHAKQWLGMTDTTQDSRLQQLITAASLAVCEYAQREFAPVTASATRVFELKRDGLLTFGNADLQSVTQVHIDTESGGSPTTLTQDQYQLWPVDAPHGVYRGIRFYTFAIGPILRQAFGLNRHVSVAGTWGFPSIPADVEQATIITVAKWFKRDEVAWSNEFPTPQLGDGLNLPFDARMLLQPYKRVV